MLYAHFVGCNYGSCGVATPKFAKDSDGFILKTLWNNILNPKGCRVWKMLFFLVEIPSSFFRGIYISRVDFSIMISFNENFPLIFVLETPLKLHRLEA